MLGTVVSKLLTVVPRSIVGRVAARYVAGTNLDQAVAKVASLNALGFKATLDILGEDAESSEHATATLTDYLAVLDRISADGLDSNISAKLTHLGIRLDDLGEQRIETIMRTANGHANFVRIDMEDSSLTKRTIDIYRDLAGRYPKVGTVLQAYLRRTENDALALAKIGANLRLCKGIYREPADIAFKGCDEIRDSYLRTAKILLSGKNTYTGFATHDTVLIDRILDLIANMGTSKDRFEFQALLGVPIEPVLERLRDSGYTVRIYVPYGPEWYAYSTRRLKENPNMATYILLNMFKRKTIAGNVG